LEHRSPFAALLLLSRRGRLAAACAGLALASCTALFFQPIGVQVYSPSQFGLKFEEVHFRTRDGVELYAWFLPAKGKPLGTIVQLHGNAENISTHFQSLAWAPERGFNVFTFDYRGYGASDGQPSLEGVQLDIDAALQTVFARADVDKDRVVMYGQSLGGALAAYYVAHSSNRDRLRGLVIESAFSDYVDIGREALADHWFTWPFQWIAYLAIDDSFAPLPTMAKISPLPLLVLHGDRDKIVAVHHATRLYDAAREPKQMWIVPGAGHIQTMKDPAQRDRLVAWLREVLAAPPGPKRD